MEFILHLYISHFPTIVSCKPSSRKDNKSFLWEPALLQLSFRSEQALGTCGWNSFCVFLFVFFWTRVSCSPSWPQTHCGRIELTLNICSSCLHLPMWGSQVVLRVNPRALYMLGKHTTSELHPQHHLWIFFESTRHTEKEEHNCTV